MDADKGPTTTSSVNSERAPLIHNSSSTGSSNDHGACGDGRDDGGGSSSGGSSGGGVEALRRFSHREGGGSKANSGRGRSGSVVEEHDHGTGFQLLPHGSLAASGFNLASATLGAGTLAIPAAMASSGAVLGSVLLVLCCSATVYSVRLLIITLETTGYVTYEEMARKLIGPRFEKLTAVLIIAFCWGITIVYVVAMGDILSPLREVKHFPKALRGEWGKRAITTLFWGTFMLPLSLAKEINTLRYASLLGMMSTGILMAAIITHAARDDETSVEQVSLARFNFNLITALPVYIFSYCCQTNSFEIYVEMKDPSPNRMTLAAAVSMGTCTLIYIMTGIAGYANFGEGIDGNILNNYAHPTQTGYIAFAFFAISITLTMAFPICIFPTRDAILQLLGYHDAYTTPSHVRLGIAGALSVASLIAGLFTPGIQVLFGILGGICGSTLSFIWPAMFILRTGEWTREKAGLGNWLATWALIIVGVIAGLLGTAISIYDQS